MVSKVDVKAVINAQIEELKSIGIFIVTVHLRVCPDMLWERIKARLAKHPERKLYNEHKREWMEEVGDWIAYVVLFFSFYVIS